MKISVEAGLERLRETGHKLTTPRRLVLKLLSNAERPLTAQDVGAQLAEHHVNLVTVYRCLNLFAQLGIVRQLEFRQGFSLYEMEDRPEGHHHHLVCTRCGRFEDFEGCDLSALEASLSQRTDFQIESHALDFYGVCGDCARHAAPAAAPA